MVRLTLYAEFQEAKTVEEARSILNSFREATQPSGEWEISLFEDPAGTPEVLP
jgi:hypothetical protein